MRQKWLAFILSLSAILAICSPVNGATMPQMGAASGAAFDRSNIAFRSAITIEAMQRSNDVIVRRLVGQISDLKRQLTTGKGDANKSRLELARAQDEMVRRLSETDARYAAERAAFVQAISSLFDTGDARVLMLLHRYAEGDATAVTELQALFARSAASRPPRLIDQRAIATLVIDAVRKDDRKRREEIDATEAALRRNPNDYGALLQLRGLYMISSQIDRSREISDRIAIIEAGRGFDEAPQMRAMTFGQNSWSSLESGRLDDALDFATRAVTLARTMVAERYEIWQAKHPGSRESRDVIESFAREQLAMALSYLRRAQAAQGHYDGAILSGEEGIALRRLNVEIEIRQYGGPVSVYYAYAVSDALAVGELKLAKGNVLDALSTYRTALALEKLGPVTLGKEPIEPHWILIPMARAAIAANDLDEAERALTRALKGLRQVEPSKDTVASEGMYWLETGDLLEARRKPADARLAWANAEAALTQAISLDRDHKEWRKALDEVEARLAK